MNEVYAIAGSLAFVSFYAAFWIKGPDVYHWIVRKRQLRGKKN